MVVRYRYRPAPIQPVLLGGKEGASLSLAKQAKAVEEDDPFADFYKSTYEEPAFHPSQTQNKRVEYTVSSDERQLRRKQYPTINERVEDQRAWAQQQLQESKIAIQRAAVKRSREQLLKGKLAQATDAKPEDFDRYEHELNQLLQESDETILGDGSSNEAIQASVARQLVDLKERKVLATAKTAHLHRPYTLWQRRRKAIWLKMGLLHIKKGLASIVLPWLLIGPRELACDQTQLTALGITHILNMTHDCPNMFPNSYVYERVQVKDSVDSDLSHHFATISSFIQRAEDCKGRILVHCTAGASRAPTAVLSYLMTKKQLPLLDAYMLLQHIRSCVRPNNGFLYQLAMLEVRLCGHCSVYFHKDWRFYEFNTFRAQELPGRASLGMFRTVLQLYDVQPEIEGSAELRQLFVKYS